MNEQKLINEVENIIVVYADRHGNIKAWKAKRIAERLVKHLNIHFVSGSASPQFCTECGKSGCNGNCY